MRVFTAIISASLVLSGCGAASLRNAGSAANSVSNASYSIDDGKRVATEHHDGQTNDMERFKAGNHQTEDRAKAIAARVEMIPGVENSTAVITGNTAIIGITLRDELSDERLLELKRAIEDAVMEKDSRIGHVAVTTAPDLIKRIVDINHDGQSGADDINPHADENEETDMFFRRVPHEE